MDSDTCFGPSAEKIVQDRDEVDKDLKVSVIAASR